VVTVVPPTEKDKRLGLARNRNRDDESARPLGEAHAARPPVEQAPMPSGTISCSAPVGIAWDGMKETLFRPFSFSKWFILGFSAWLATLGEGGGSGGPPNFSSSTRSRPSGGDIKEAIKSVRPFLEQHEAKVAAIAAIVIVGVVVVSLVVLWLRSRGKFMFLDNVATDCAEIGRPWRVFAQHGNSLFLWSVGYGVICLLVTCLLGALTVFGIVVPCVNAGQYLASVTPVIVLMGVLWLIFAVVAGYIGRFLEDFVVPIMYKHDLTCLEAWGRFLTLLKANTGKFVVYGLFYFLLGLLAGICILLAIIATCCIAACLMGIPYLGAVVLLPVTVFFRLYSIEYLAQFGPDYTIVPEE